MSFLYCLKIQLSLLISFVALYPSTDHCKPLSLVICTKSRVVYIIYTYVLYICIFLSRFISTFSSSMLTLLHSHKDGCFISVHFRVKIIELSLMNLFFSQTLYFFIRFHPISFSSLAFVLVLDFHNFFSTCLCPSSLKDINFKSFSCHFNRHMTLENNSYY